MCPSRSGMVIALREKRMRLLPRQLCKEMNETLDSMLGDQALEYPAGPQAVWPVTRFRESARC